MLYQFPLVQMYNWIQLPQDTMEQPVENWFLGI